MTKIRRRHALQFVVILGFVSLFADMTYEGARSAVGPFLGLLGASATVVAMVSGAGELIGYVLRLPAGYFADRTRLYWPLAVVGYAINLLAVPLLAFAGQWEVAAALVVLERAGRALRKPPTDAMMSHAVSEMGRGWGFGLREAMDQTGAVLGPLFVAWVLARRLGLAGYASAFGWLIVPAVLSIGTLCLGWWLYPSPEQLELKRAGIHDAEKMRRVFWVYVVAASFLAAGTVDLPFAAFHLAKTGVASPSHLAILYAVAMGTAAVTAPLVGLVYDRVGLMTVAFASVIPAAATACLFLGGSTAAVVGTIVWGVGMGVQEATVRAVVADLTPADRRSSAYGIFDAAFGVAWFAGSAAMGLLYRVSPLALVWFAVGTQAVAVGALVAVARMARALRSAGSASP